MAYLWASSSCQSASALRSPMLPFTESGSDGIVSPFGFMTFPFTLLTDLLGIKLE